MNRNLGLAALVPQSLALSGGAPLRSAMPWPTTGIVVPSDQQIRILMFGDSYIAGDQSADGLGPRGLLADWLHVQNESRDPAGRALRYVGTLNTAGVAPAVDRAPRTGIPIPHEGHGGWAISELRPLISNGRVNGTEPPQVVIVAAGSNDFGERFNRSAPQVADQMLALVLALLALPSQPVIVVMECVEHSSSVSHQLTDNTRRIQEYNQDCLPNALSPYGDRVVIAPVTGDAPYALDQTHLVMPQGVHPNEAGRQRYTRAMYKALAPWFGYHNKYMVPV